MNVEAVECGLVEVLADVQSMMRSRALDKGIDFTLEYATSIPERVVTDPTRLRQILMNLVGNAIKFTDAGGVRVVVHFEQLAALEPEAGPREISPTLGSLLIEVIDTGVGISIEQQRMLFQPLPRRIFPRPAGLVERDWAFRSRGD